MSGRLKFVGNLSTTAMGIMPHRDVDRALEMALRMDVPFWPQLPKMSFYEDMYVQALEIFPGAVFDEGRGRVHIDTDRFLAELPGYLDREDVEEAYRLSERFSSVFPRFLAKNLDSHRAIRGQIISPVSLTLKVTDEKGKPIAYNDDMRALAFSFIQKKLNVQYRELRAKNERAFVWIDDPGLEFIFSALCGYDNVRAKTELLSFFDAVEGPRGLHLCGQPDWDFLLSLNIEILSFNAYASGDIFVTYDRLVDFLVRGGVVVWGIVPTGLEDFGKETVKALADRLEAMWAVLRDKGFPAELIVRQSMLAPATCNLVNSDETATVEKAFEVLHELSRYLKGRYQK
jgi:hypothetical protein